MQKVSVIIPFYNGEKYIVDLLSSIDKQSYTNLEIIIVNDGSQPNSKSILLTTVAEFPNLDIRVIDQSNGGISEARNTGLKHATGELITFIDQDDMLCGRYSIELRVDLINESGYDAICGFTIKVDQDGKIIHTKAPRHVEEYIKTSIADPAVIPMDYINYYLEKQKLYFFSTGSGLFKRGAIGDTLFRKEYDKIEDIDWTVRLFAKGVKFKLMKMPFYFKRQHLEQASKGTPQELEVMIMEQMRNFLVQK